MSNSDCNSSIVADATTVPEPPAWWLAAQAEADAAAQRSSPRDHRRAQLRIVERDERQEIELRAGALESIIPAAQCALSRLGGMYRRGDFVMRPEWQPEVDAQDERVRRPAGAMLLVELDQDWLQIELARAARWVKFDARSERLKPADPTVAVARACLARKGEWALPRLRGIVRAPTLRADGSLLDRDGYDARSGLLADFDPAAFPPIPTAPTRADALAALALLRDALREFPFSSAESAAAAIAILITALVRQSLPAAPAAGITASTAGTGKTELASGMIGQIAIGVAPSCVSPPGDEEETRKALLGMLVAGDPIVVIDNASRPIESDALCTAITEPRLTGRWLGGNASVSASTATAWIITGNALEIVGDLCTRFLMIELDAMLERPDERNFERGDFREWVAEHRGELVRAALTIPLAYLAAGTPRVEARPSRFHKWDRMVRHPLLWLGLADPLDTQHNLQKHDPERETLGVLLAVLHARFGEKPFTSGELVRAAQAEIDAARVGGRPLGEESLGVIIQAVAAAHGGPISPRRLGRYLTKRLHRIVEGLRLNEAGEDTTANSRRYCVSAQVGAAGEPAAGAKAQADEDEDKKWERELQWATDA